MINAPPSERDSFQHFGGVSKRKGLSEVGFEPTPTDVDCDLNAAP